MVRSGLLVALAAVVLAGCTGGAGPRTTAPAGLGDPYFPDAGNPGYQVDHYHLQVGYDPASKQLTGLATITATATDDLTRFSLDFAGLTVRSVTVEGSEAANRRDDDKLVVTPAATVADGAQFEVAVAYDGIPEPLTSPALGSNGFRSTDDGAFAIGQPQSASTWFPVNDHPLDKATYTIEVTVPADVVALSNGVPAGQSTSDGQTTWRWEERIPMASYLSTVVIGDYRVHTDSHDGKPLVVAVHSDLPTAVDSQLQRTGEIADVLAEWFGPYPMDSYGGIALADRGVGFALETQSRPVYSPGFFRDLGSGSGDASGDGEDATWVIVHELAHQWFGNSVSVRYWNEMWLNEGFATYAEWLWSEEMGDDTAQETFDLYWNGPAAEDEFWSPPAGDPGPADLFGHAVYERGAMVLHALRMTVGDRAFFEILPTWAEEKRDGNVTTAEFQSLCERISGRPLGDLFDAWVYGTDRPSYPGDP